MAKGYNNVLHLSAKQIEIQKFSARIVGKASSGETNFDTLGQGELERLYISLFGAGNSTYSQIVTGLDRISLLARTLTEWCEEIQKLRPSENDTLTHIRHSEEIAVMQIQLGLACVNISSD